MNALVYAIILLVIPALGMAGEITSEMSGHKVSLVLEGKIAKGSSPRAGFVFASFPTPEGTEVKEGEIFESTPCEVSLGIYALTAEFYQSEEKTYKMNTAFKVSEEKSENGKVYVMKRNDGNGTDSRRRQYIEDGSVVYVVDVSWCTMRGYPAKIKSDIEKEFMSALKSISLNGKKWDGAKNIKIGK
jgi:hypothetical protein